MTQPLPQLHTLFFFFQCCISLNILLVLKQMKPSYTPGFLFDENKVSEKPRERINPVTQLWHQNGVCSEGTIPVRRTKKDDVLRASSVKRYGKKKLRTVPLPRSADPDLINQSGHQVDFDFFYLHADVLLGIPWSKSSLLYVHLVCGILWTN